MESLMGLKCMYLTSVLDIVALHAGTCKALMTKRHGSFVFINLVYLYIIIIITTILIGTIYI